VQPHLKLLGGYELVASNGEKIRLPTRKSWALLAYLVQSGKIENSREELATLLWPNSGEDQARASLRQELAVLRKTMLEAGIKPIIAQKEAIQFNPDGLSIDTRELHKIAQSSPESNLHQVADLYAGDFISGLNIRSEVYDEWLWLERQHLRDMALSCLLRALTHDEMAGNPAKTIATAKSLLTIEPIDENAHRALMQSYWITGRKTEALKQFKHCQNILMRDLDTGPSAETVALADKIRLEQQPKAKQPSITKDACPSREKREITVLVFGVSNIEDLSQTHDPEELSSRLNACAQHCQQAVQQFGGKLVNRLGDKLVFVFGFPTANEHDSERAVLAALNAIQTTETSSKETPILLSCGISQGEMLVDPQAGSSNEQPAFSGAALINATKLEQMAKGSETLVSFATHASLKNKFDMNLVQSTGNNTRAYSVQAEKPYASRFEIRGISDGLTRLTGRKQELAELEKIWATTCGGSGGLAIIQGEPGIGKSRLAYRFVEKVNTGNPTVLQFSGSPHHGQSALFPVIQCLQHYLGLETITDETEKLETLTNWIDTLGLDQHSFLRPLCNLMSPVTIDVEKLEANLTGLQSEPPIETLVACFRALAREKPLLLLFEDLHWMDPTTELLIKTMATQVPKLPAMVLLTLRPEGRPKWFQKTPMLTVELTRLSPQQCVDFVRHISPSSWPADMIDKIITRSDGIPLFLEELVNSMLDEHSEAANIKTASVPESLQASLTARIDRLGAAKPVLQLAAVIGRVFDHSLLEKVVDMSPKDLESILVQLQNRRLIYRIGRAPYARYEFKHVLVQELTYRLILKQQRAQYHLQIATALRDRLGGNSAQTPEITARHFEMAGRPEDAIVFLETAGKQAVRVSAHQEAVTHFSKAVSLVTSFVPCDDSRALELKFLLLLGPQLIAAHGFASDQAIEVYARARALGSQSKDTRKLCHVLWGLWGHYVVGANIRTAKDISEQFLTLAIRADDEIDMVAGHYMIGVTQFYSGQLSAAEESFNTSLQLYHPDQHSEQAVRVGVDLSVTAQSYLTWVYALQGRTMTAETLAQQVVANAEKTKHDFSIGFAQVFVASMYNFLSLTDRAEQHASVTAALSGGQGFAQFQAQAKIQLGRAIVQKGDARGLEQMQSGMRSYYGTGAGLARPYAQAWLAEAYADKGAIDQAITIIDEAMGFTHKSGVVYFDSELLRLKAKFLHKQGGPQLDIANVIYAESIKLAKASGAHLLYLRAAKGYADLLSEMGHNTQAEQILQDALAVQKSSNNQLGIPTNNR